MLIDETNKFYTWITRAESAFSNVESEYTEAREYYEDIQTPSDVPDDKDYIQENIITDTIDRSVGSLVSGDLRPVIVGGGDMAKPARELHDDILEANDFKERLLPSMANKFNCEGLAGVKVIDNPYKKSRYGIGFLELKELKQGRLLLDPNSQMGLHEDDIFRIHKERRLKSYALDKWGKTKAGRKNKLYDQITDAAEESNGQETEKFVNVYEIEYKETKFRLVDGVRIEEEKYYVTKIINKTVQVEEPRPTGYPCFRLIPMIHTPREADSSGGYPMGLYKKLKQQQDQLNITASVTLDAVKASIKNLKVLRGQNVTPEEEIQFKEEAAKTDGFLFLRSPNARIDEITGQPLPAQLLQWHQWQRESFDDIKGSSNQAQQFQSAASGQLSGKAIGNLQFAGMMPEYTKKANMEYALKQVSTCILHYIRTKMTQPFTITRPIEGNEVEIPFNRRVAPNYQPRPELDVVNDGMVNVLSELGDMDVKIEIELNMQQKKELELNKAFILAQAGKISDQDLLEAAYPNSWKDKYQRMLAQNQAASVVAELAEMTGDQNALQILQNSIAQFKGKFKDGKFTGTEEELAQMAGVV